MSPRSALIHVDLDNLWSIAACYGLCLPAGSENGIYDDALPRLLGIFNEMEIPATFFAVGRDVELPDNAVKLRKAIVSGHEIASHSQTHPLNFRALSEREIDHEVEQGGKSIYHGTGQKPSGFRAPGYAVSQSLIRVLIRRGYHYDSSIMPSPYGFAFRWMDAWLRRGTTAGSGLRKTQFPYFCDALASLSPYRVNPNHPERELASSGLLEIPVAASPLLRLPFQAGVCLRLGRRYFEAQLSAFLKRPSLPLVFLLHGADAADFQACTDPFFRRAPVFSLPFADRIGKIRIYLERIRSNYDCLTTMDFVRRIKT
ncbi:MAG: polysaccharide deacetylase family protein [bacterium]|nr:polysaccharide deacetylase family protein [Candidatus Sumerlaeota bacterium]